MVQTGDNERCVEETEQTGKQPAETGGKTRVNDIGDERADSPADRTDNGMCQDYGRN